MQPFRKDYILSKKRVKQHAYQAMRLRSIELERSIDDTIVAIKQQSVYVESVRTA